MGYPSKREVKTWGIKTCFTDARAPAARLALQMIGLLYAQGLCSLSTCPSRPFLLSQSHVCLHWCLEAQLRRSSPFKQGFAERAGRMEIHGEGSPQLGLQAAALRVTAQTPVDYHCPAPTGLCPLGVGASCTPSTGIFRHLHIPASKLSPLFAAGEDGKPLSPGWGPSLCHLQDGRCMGVHFLLGAATLRSKS